MIEVEVNEQQIAQQSRAFARLMVSDKETRKRIKKIVREEMKDAAKRVREDARYEMKEDPRKTFRAVKFSVYKKILGGNVSILNPRKAGARYELIKPRTLNPYGPGGNRRKRGDKTKAIDSYFGKDRAFILRFLNSGVGESGRSIKFTPNENRKVDKWNRHPNTGNRGSIAARNWFANMAPKEMELAAGNLAAVIEEELVEAYNEIIKD